MGHEKFVCVEFGKHHPLKYYLSDEERESYNENGYLIIKGLIDLTTIDALKQKFIEICNGKVASEGINIVKERNLFKTKQNPEDYVLKIIELHHHPFFMMHIEHPRLLHVLSQLLGQDLSILNAMIINKPPGTKSHPAHQDVFYFPVRPLDKGLSTWTAVEPVAEDNGCVFVIPGSHKMGLLPHVHMTEVVNDVFFVIPDTEEGVTRKRVNLAPMDPGDTLIMHSLLVHGSWANESDRYRKAISNVYLSNECQYIDVTGTIQEMYMKKIKEYMAKRYGPDMADVKLEELWQKRRLTITKSNLTFVESAEKK